MPINGDTLIQNLPLTVDQVSTVIVLTNIDNNQLTAACNALGVTPVVSRNFDY